MGRNHRVWGAEVILTQNYGRRTAEAFNGSNGDFKIPCLVAFVLKYIIEMKRPLFSCVIPIKGARPYFNEALQSLFAQGMRDELEIIVQEGAEGGAGEPAAESLASDREKAEARGEKREECGVRWFCEDDKGQSDALNRGFARARGEWLFWLNADDVLLRGALKSLADRVKSLEFRDVEWIAGDTVYLDR